MSARSRATPDVDYRKLLEFRTALRRFLAWSEQEAVAAGLTPAQHQLLLVVKGLDLPQGPTVGDVAGQLLLRHNSAGELVARASKAGLVRLISDPEDHRVVHVGLTARGERVLRRLAARHVEEIAVLAHAVRQLTPVN